MPGLYLHIPFCRQACHYCDFHFSTSLKYKDDMIGALLQEINLQRDYLADKRIETIYFGGGTPSILTASDISRLIGRVSEHFELTQDAEITLEANPDDLGKDVIHALKDTPVNRLSVGVQSFYDEDLKWMNRSHSAEQALSGIKRAQDAGFENITLDLIYGFQDLSNAKWKYNIRTALELDVPHISSYSLTVEPRTALAKFIKTGKENMPPDEQAADQFLLLIDELVSSGYMHYEISNFAKPGYQSRHNSNYWMNQHYLGIGPSAHSYNGSSRQWNIPNNFKYMESISKGIVPFEREELSPEQQTNEYLMTSLRTARGIDLSYLKTLFGDDVAGNVAASAGIFIEKKWLYLENHHLILSREGKLFADKIASELFII